jgi:prepilin-type N-terminal cleavage/methylation domain-containing protein
MFKKKAVQKVKNSGFTLVELMIVIIIIGILGSMSLLYAPKMTAKANAAEIVNNMKVLKSAAISYYADHGSWPGGEEEAKIKMLINTYTDGSTSFAKGYAPYNVWGGVNGVERVWVKCFLTKLPYDSPELRQELRKIAEKKEIPLYNNAWDDKFPPYNGGEMIVMPVI